MWGGGGDAESNRSLTSFPNLIKQKRSKYKGLNNKLLTDIIKTGHLIFHFDGYFSNLSKFYLSKGKL